MFFKTEVNITVMMQCINSKNYIYIIHYRVAKKKKKDGTSCLRFKDLLPKKKSLYKKENKQAYIIN